MTDFERNIKYQTKLRKYNEQVKKNQERTNRINDLRNQNNELSSQVERLKGSKANIDGQVEPIISVIRKLNTAPNYEEFKGTKETNYWTQRKQPIINDVEHFKNNINQAINKINQKIKELENKIDSNMHAITKLNGQMTNPVRPIY